MRRLFCFISLLLFNSLFFLFAKERDFTTLFPAQITKVESYDLYDVEFLDIYPDSVSKNEKIRLIGITDIDDSSGEDFELFKEQMTDVYVYVMFDYAAGIIGDNNCAQGVILYCEDDELFYGEDGDGDYTGTTETLYELISISCRLVWEGIAIVDPKQKLSPHIQMFLDFTQILRNKEIEKNEKKK